MNVKVLQNFKYTEPSENNKTRELIKVLNNKKQIENICVSLYWLFLVFTLLIIVDLSGNFYFTLENSKNKVNRKMSKK